MGSKLGTLTETPNHRHSVATAVSESGGDGTFSLSHGTNLIDGSASRPRDSGTPDATANESVVGGRQRHRAVSNSEGISHPVDSSDVLGNGSMSTTTGNRSRTSGSRRPYSLFSHYWDAFLNSDSDDSDNLDEDSDDESSSDSEHHRRRRRGSSNRQRHSRRRHRHSDRDRGPFFTSTSSSASASTSASNALSINFPVSSSSALSRASNRRRLRALIAAHSLPFPLFSVSDFKCPVCHKIVPSEDFELHVVVCLTKPKINYNVDVLSEDKGECIICFDDMFSGDTIARLPCLCIYHKHCIDQWFDVRRACPAHPPDDD